MAAESTLTLNGLVVLSLWAGIVCFLFIVLVIHLDRGVINIPPIGHFVLSTICASFFFLADKIINSGYAGVHDGLARPLHVPESFKIRGLDETNALEQHFCSLIGTRKKQVCKRPVK